MNSCPKCAKTIPIEAASFCPFCGANLSRPAKKPVRHKRANGTGSVYKRGKTWTAAVTDGFDVIGDTSMPQNCKLKQRRRIVNGFATKTDALMYIDKIRQQKTLGNTKSLDYYWQLYLNGGYLQISSQKQCQLRGAYNKLSSIKDKPIQNITLSELQQIITGCKTFSPAVLVKIVLSHIYKLAAAEKVADSSILQFLVLPKSKAKPRGTFSDEEQKRLWTCYESGQHPECAIPLIMIYTGMMPGEMRQLDKSMIHLEEKEIVGVGIKTETRRNESVLLPDVIIPVLEDCIAASNKNTLFPTSEAAFKRMYAAALSAADVEYKTPYCCRHTAATALAVNEKLAPQIVKRAMRWKNTKMMDTYVHPTEQSVREAINERK